VFNPKGWDRSWFNFPYASNLTGVERDFTIAHWNESEDCYASHDAYNFYISALYKDHRYMTSQTYTETWVTHRSTGEGALYTIPSEGIPRYCFDGPITTLPASTFTMERVRTISAIPVNQPEWPKCDVVPAWCKIMSNRREAIDGKSRALEFGPSKTNQVAYDRMMGFIEDPCDRDLDLTSSTECDVEIENEVVLIYWPEEGDMVDKCDKNKGRDKFSRRSDGPKRPPAPVITDKIVFQGQDLYKTGHWPNIQGK
jgi:hypothetical protein